MRSNSSNKQDIEKIIVIHLDGFCIRFALIVLIGDEHRAHIDGAGISHAPQILLIKFGIRQAVIHIRSHLFCALKPIGRGPLRLLGIALEKMRRRNIMIHHDLAAGKVF